MEIAVVGIYLPVRARRQVGIGVGIGIESYSHASIPIATPIETNQIYVFFHKIISFHIQLKKFEIKDSLKAGLQRRAGESEIFLEVEQRKTWNEAVFHEIEESNLESPPLTAYIDKSDLQKGAWACFRNLLFGFSWKCFPTFCLF